MICTVLPYRVVRFLGVLKCCVQGVPAFVHMCLSMGTCESFRLADLSPEEAKESVVGVFLTFPQLVGWQCVPTPLQLASISSSNQVYQTLFPVLGRKKVISSPTTGAADN